MDKGLESLLVMYLEELSTLDENSESYPFAFWLEYSLEFSGMSVTQWTAHCCDMLEQLAKQA